MDSAHIKGITDFPYMLVLEVVKSTVLYLNRIILDICVYILTAYVQVMNNRPNTQSANVTKIMLSPVSLIFLILLYL